MTTGHLADIVLGPPGAGRFVRAVVVIFTIAAVFRIVPVPRRRAGRAHRRSLPRAAVPTLAAITAAAVITSGFFAWTSHHHAPQAAQASMSQVGVPAVAHAAAVLNSPPVGVFEPSSTASYRLVDEFTKATGAQPRYVLYYSGWNDPFQVRFAARARAAGAVPFVQMEPNGVQLRAIAVGRYDAYLQSFARAVRAFGQQVIVGFAPEMNGNWYGWGFGHTAAATWVTAWRHLVTTFRACGATNATWLWTVNSVNAASAPLRPWWPGASYVTWVGIDGYYYRPADTFASVFGATLAQVRRFTAAPVLISETAVGPSSRQPAQIEDLFASARARHLQGVVWFDMAQRGSPYHLDWRLEDSPAGLAAFRRAARTGT